MERRRITVNTIERIGASVLTGELSSAIRSAAMLTMERSNENDVIEFAFDHSSAIALNELSLALRAAADQYEKLIHAAQNARHDAVDAKANAADDIDDRILSFLESTC